MQVLTMDGQVLALELPQTVDMEIIETVPGIKGASAALVLSLRLYLLD